MARPRWTPDNEEQRVLAERAVASFARVDEIEEQAWRDLASAANAGVSITWLASRIGRSRPTVYRRLRALMGGRSESE